MTLTTVVSDYVCLETPDLDSNEADQIFLVYEDRSESEYGVFFLGITDEDGQYWWETGYRSIEAAIHGLTGSHENYFQREPWSMLPTHPCAECDGGVLDNDYLCHGCRREALDDAIPPR